MKGLNLRGVAEFCRTVVREPRLLLPQVSVQGADPIARISIHTGKHMRVRLNCVLCALRRGRRGNEWMMARALSLSPIRLERSIVPDAQGPRFPGRGLRQGQHTHASTPSGTFSTFAGACNGGILRALFSGSFTIVVRLTLAISLLLSMWSAFFRGMQESVW